VVGGGGAAVGYRRRGGHGLLLLAEAYIGCICLADNQAILDWTFRDLREIDTLEALRLYVAIAETGSLSAAARQVSVSTSTVTGALQQLEEQARSLITRSTRRLSFTFEGRRFLADSPARVTAGWHAFNITSDQGSGIGGWSDDEVFAYLASGHTPGRGTAAGPMGEAVDQSFSQMAPSDIRALVSFVRSVPPIASPDLPATLAPPAPASPKAGGATPDALGKRIFQESCVSCHDWTGVSAITPYATVAGARGVNDRTATNFAQIVISGTMRHTPAGVVSMPAFGSTHSDTEIAAVSNYVTARFGSARSGITDKDVAGLRSQTAR